MTSWETCGSGGGDGARVVKRVGVGVGGGKQGAVGVVHTSVCYLRIGRRERGDPKWVVLMTRPERGL